jgi:hypothetical protein
MPGPTLAHWQQAVSSESFRVENQKRAGPRLDSESGGRRRRSGQRARRPGRRPGRGLWDRKSHWRRLEKFTALCNLNLKRFQVRAESTPGQLEVKLSGTTAPRSRRLIRRRVPQLLGALKLMSNQRSLRLAGQKAPHGFKYSFQRAGPGGTLCKNEEVSVVFSAVANQFCWGFTIAISVRRCSR